MRKVQQAKILELLQTLEEATDELCRQTSLEVLYRLLADMQDFALQIGRYIESIEGENTKTVVLLEKFCDVLCKIYQEKSVTQYEKKLKRRILGLKSAVRSELKANRIEIVFFPYMASMADSLQSIWEAALADPDCDVLICPIPYFDRLPDGTFGQMYYEGDTYSKGLPLVHWQEYDVEACRPDIIYIHNPYDKYNCVTSVHPNFYSKRLSSCTDMLVYVPYFVVPGDVPEHLCTTAGCIYAHKAIVQSEKVRNTYIHAFQKKFGDRFGNPEEKFISLGSPKFDRVIQGKREDWKLSKKWEKLIADKKVVLYNTSVGAILQGDEQYLTKLQNVLNLFRERKDVVLWWRPHPLSESTFESMRPAFADRYREIVARYRRESYGIYDDSADVNRAVVYADCYYGDNGSAVEAVFFATGKPIMIQRVDVSDDSLIAPILLGADESRLFFSPLYSTAIMSFDLATQKIKIVQAGHSTMKRPYSLGVNFSGDLYFTPVASTHILKLDTRTGRFIEIPFEVKQDSLLRLNPQYQTGSNFLQSYAYDGKIFFVGYYYPAVMCYRPQDGELFYSSDWPSAFKSGDAGNISNWSCQMDAKIVIVGSSPVILFFEMETNRFSVEKISHESAVNGFSTVTYAEGFLWFMAKKDGTILKLNPQTKKLTVYNQFPSGVKRCKSMCISSVYVNGYIWFFSDNTNAILRINAKDGEISVVRMFPDAEIGDAVHLGLIMLINHKIYASLLHDPGFSIYDIDTGSHTKIPVRIACNVDNVNEDPMDIHDTIMLENGFDDINTLLNSPSRKNEKLIADWISSPEGCAGEKIHKYVKALIVKKQ